MSRDSQTASSVPQADARRGTDRGSVLIFVVGILLLLAIIATAFLGNSQSDRTATQQNAYNTQIDLLLDGVVNAMKGAIESDAYGKPGANAADALVATNVADADSFLASRIPTAPNPGAAISGTNPPLWTSITGPVMGGAFSYPMRRSDIGNPPPAFNLRQFIEPTSLTYRGQSIPALRVFPDLITNGSTATAFVVPGIDADNDGIADSAMVELPTGPLSGVTYYYGARILDLNSAINVNTAWMSNNPTALGAPFYASPANLTPSNVDLIGLLRETSGSAQQNQMDALNNYRTDNAGPAGFNLFPVDDSGTARTDFTFSGTTGTSTDALWMQLGRRLDNPGRRTPTLGGVRYKPFDRTVSSTLFSQFIVANPSFQTALDNALADSLTASGGSIATRKYDPSRVANWFNENFAFPNRDGTTVPFPLQVMPLRSLLTTTNTVRDVAPALPATTSATVWAANTFYTYGMVVSFALPGQADARNYVCLQPHTSPASVTTAGAPGTPGGRQYWGLLNWTRRPQRIDVNVADFGELWWGFRQVMAALPDVTLATTNIPTPYVATTKGRQFRNPVRDPAATPQFPAPAGGSRFLAPTEMLQVRTALAAVNAIDLRDGDTNVTGRRITTYDYTVNPPTPLHEVTVFGSEPQPYITEVYVNADSEPGPMGGAGNVNGYVAIELYNPYPFDMNLAGWTLGRINRSTGTYPLTILPVLKPADYPANHFISTNNVIVPANGYLVLENYNGIGAGDPDDADHRPPDAEATLISAIKAEDYQPGGGSTAPGGGTGGGPVKLVKYVSRLGSVLSGATIGGTASTGGELVLLRPRVWSPAGTFTYNDTTAAGQEAANAEDPHNEGTGSNPGGVIGANGPVDFVPVDSFDFTGMATMAPGLPNYFAWHYTRQNDVSGGVGGGTWKWTHAGPYSFAGGSTRQGTNAVVAPGATPAFPGNAVNLGGSDTTASWGVDTFLGTQINPIAATAATTAAGFTGPSPFRPDGPAANVSNKSPFGAFALETDILQIPFIGAYRVRTLGAGGDPLPTDFTEMNALPMDWSFADDEDTQPGNDDPNLYTGGSNNSIEQVGRFCPLSVIDPVAFQNWGTSAAPVSPIDTYDFQYIPTLNPVVRNRTVFDVFTTRSPAFAYLPNVSADAYAAAIAIDPLAIPAPVITYTAKQMPAVTYSTVQSGSGTSIQMQNNVILSDPNINFNGYLIEVLSGTERGKTAVINASSGRSLTLATPLAVGANDAFRILGPSVEGSGFDGLVNINTAPWPVLARLPWAFTATGTVDRGVSEQIAKQIVAYRDGDPTAGTPQARGPRGPFRSLLDLNRVLDGSGTVAVVQTAANRTAAGAAVPSVAAWTAGLNMAADYGSIEGDLTPFGGTDSMAGDYETRFLALSRVGNLVTTRSDAFVVYINLQGWRDAGTAAATLVAQRRVALIVDRSGQVLSTMRVPSN